MKNFSYILLVLVLTVSNATAQKTLEKAWNTRGIDTLEIITDDVFNIRITSKRTSTISLNALVEGELYEQTLVNAKLRQKTLRISTDLSPYFEPENDKLAAHKVMSVELQLTVPSSISVVIRSKLASVMADGAYRYFEVGLEQGRCTINNFSGSAKLYTIQGDIQVTAARNVSAEAVSKYGAVTNKLRKYGAKRIEAESIYGGISLLRSQ